MLSEDRTRDYFFKEGLKGIPRLLSLFNFNRLSRNYGCFDRNYWQYRITEFPSGIFQLCALPLALAYHIDSEGNVFYKSESLKEVIHAAIEFAKRSSHRDGSCDDYYLNERAVGATAFSLYGLTEAFLKMEFNDSSHIDFLKKRAHWLIANSEPYPLANHQALIALGLYNLFLITGEEQYEQSAKKQIEKVLSLQSPEGWFEEYGGLDPGYLTFTISFLGKYYKKSEDFSVKKALEQAVAMASVFLNPDGSYGGDYGSRNTSAFLSHGFEITAQFCPPATTVVDTYVRGCYQGKKVHLEDDRSYFLIMEDYLQSYMDFCPRRRADKEERISNGIHFFQQAGVVIVKSEETYWVISGKKAGANSFFSETKNRHNDCGFMAELANGQLVATHQADSFYLDEKEGLLFVRGCFGSVAKENQWTTAFGLLLFKIFAFLVCRSAFLSRYIKQFLTRLLILIPKRSPVIFERVFYLRAPHRIVNKIWLPDKKMYLKRLYQAHHVSYRYTAGSQFYQEAVLMPWREHSWATDLLNERKSIELETLL